MITIVATIIALGFLIFIHETGHFLFAKLFKMRVDRFSIGYPPRLTGKKIGDTDYCISAIPFGGHVKIAGMVDESLDAKEMEGEPKPWEFRSKPWFQRALVILSGSLMNLFFAYIVFTSAAMVYGTFEQVPGTSVGRVQEGSPAEQAGLMPGDRIVTINGEILETWQDMTERIHPSAGQEILIEWIREGERHTAVIIPKRVTDFDPEEVAEVEVGQIGIGPVLEHRTGLVQAFVGGAETMGYFMKLIFVSLKKLILREESIRSLGGPIAIAQMAGESARSGFGAFIGFMAFLSLNLGILNLLPIPVLDGGHMVFLSIEGVIRKPLPLKVKLAIQQIGMLLILILMIFVVYNDILRIFQK